MPALGKNGADNGLGNNGSEKPGSNASKGSMPPRRNTPGLHLSQMTKVNRDDGDDSEEDSADEFARFQASSGPTTPNISETAAQLRRSLSVTGLQDLAHMPRSQIRKSVGSKVWRPHDEEARLPSDWERLVVHVVRGGLRAGNLAFALRATLMLMLELIKSIRTKKFNKDAFGIALMGPRNFRFAAMFAIWASLYKAVHNSLRLMTPPPVKKVRSRSASGAGSSGFSIEKSSDGSVDDAGAGSGTATPRSGRAALEGKSPEEKAKERARQKRRAFMPDPRSKVWHAYVAGAISALAVVAETHENRVALAQQLFVRGLEGSYNVAHERGIVNIPYGAVITFGLACGQIMWAWLEAPDSLPKSYKNWITRASQVSPPVTDVYRAIRHEGKADPAFALKWFPDSKVPEPISVSPLRYADVPANSVNRRGIKGKNVRKIVEWMDRTKKGDCGDIVDCALVHPWETSHWRSPVDRYIEVTRWILPVYLTLHFVPAIFLRPGKFLKNPIDATIRSLRGSFRSSSFLGVFVIIFQTQFCAQHSLYNYIQAHETLRRYVPTWFKRMIISSWVKWVTGFTTCLSLFVDDSRRRAELAAYVLPKGMESAWSVLRKKSYVPFVPGGDLLLTSAGMSLVMGTYAQNPEHLSGLVRRIVYQFVGRN